MLASSPSVNLACQTGRRVSARLRTRLAARLEVLDGVQDCILVDISLEGACIRTNKPVRVRNEAVLTWHGFEAFGQVVWATGTHCGVSFLDPITATVLLATRRLDQTDRLPEGRELARYWARSYLESGSALS
ncbi:PilZ domain-containing protein [Novosphingobium sp. 9U]|uniref:PilZ domain-containing protein n=1 Tax=Novosphingobium sp. 9U TaxID=2653158 RepID=UPI00352E929F